MNTNINIHKTGLHIRTNKTLVEITHKAIRLGLPFFQTFVIDNYGKHIIFTENDIKEFLSIRKSNFQNLYLHGSYWINLCSSRGYKTLLKEIEMAKKLQFTHFVLHPGAITTTQTKEDGLNALAKSLNTLFRQEEHIKIILENTAHSKRCLGGDLQEFYTLLKKLDKPDKISFCIDTAHAYSFGYNINNISEQKDFIELIDSIIGIQNIALIHLNDTDEKLGSKIDKHCIPGKGNIGKEALQYFANYPKISNIPILVELPIIDENEEKEILKTINSWKTKNS